MQTEFPWINAYSLEVDQVPEGGMDLLLRVPDYAKDYQVRVSEVNGTVRMVTEVTEKGYCSGSSG